MKRATKILGTATVIGLLAVPVAQSYDDWITPLLWNWVIRTANPMLLDHDAKIAQLDSRLAATESSSQPRLVVFDANDQELPVMVAPDAWVTSANRDYFRGTYLFGSALVPVVYIYYRSNPSESNPSEIGYLATEESIFFETSDCSGTPYIPSLGFPSSSESFLTNPKTVLSNGRFYSFNTETSYGVTVLAVSGLGIGCRAQETPYSATGFRGDIIGELTATMPFRLEVRQ